MKKAGTKIQRAAGGTEVLSRRDLNRALLARQHLLERTSRSCTEVIERVIGLQAQAPNPPYFGLWSRIVGFQPEQLSSLMTSRKVVRIALMRSTIHLVTAADCLALRPIIQPVLERGMIGEKGRLAGLDAGEVARVMREFVEEQPRTFVEVTAHLKRRWPGRNAGAMTYAVRAILPLVQVPPRGVWGKSGPAAHTTAEAWLGGGVGEELSREKLVLRYLAAFGPASAADMQQWSGLSRLRETIDLLRPKLRTFQDERGKELFDVPEAPRPGGEVEAPIRFLAEFDNVLLSHDDRSRILTDVQRKRIFTNNGLVPGTVLLDGFVAGTWKITLRRGTASLCVETFDPQSAASRAALLAEGGALLEFAVGKGVKHEIRFARLR